MLHPRLNDEAGRLDALARYDLALPSVNDGDFDRILGLVAAVLDVPISVISLIEKKHAHVKASIGIDGGETPREQSFCTHAIRSHSAMLIEDARLDERFAVNPAVTGAPYLRAYAGAPLITPDGYNLGALCAIDVVPRKFNEQQIALLERFAALVVDQIELRTLAHHDFLTGVLTRRSFTDHARSTLSRGKRAALLCLDIDHFKAFNENYGHAGGDRVLRAVAAECRRHLRPGDAIGRLGGEEFAVLLPDSNERAALGCAERLRRGIERLRIGGFRPVTASFGIALVHSSADVDQWLAEADSALFAAKRSGRNRTVIHDPRAAAAA